MACLPGGAREDDYFEIEIQYHEVLSHKKCYGPICVTLSCIPFVLCQPILMGSIIVQEVLSQEAYLMV